MIPFRTGGQIPLLKGFDSRIRQHNTDIDRLWAYMQELTQQGIVASGQAPGGTAPSLSWEPTVFQGLITSTLSAPTDGWGAATSCTATTYGVDPGDTSTPRVMVNLATTVTLVNRDPSLSGAVGKYIRWIECQLDDGSTENMVTWIECP